MSNLISSGLKTSAKNAMKDIFDTFKRDTQITFYKQESTQVTMVDPDFNADWGGQGENFDFHDTVFTETTESSSFNARVWYEDFNPLKYSFQGEENFQIKLNHDWGTIKIMLESDGHNYIKDAERIIFLGEEFRKKESAKAVGILGDPQFYIYILQHVN